MDTKKKYCNEINIKKNIDIISKNICNMAVNLNAKAVIVIGYEDLNLNNINNIPILYTVSNIDTIIEKLNTITTNIEENVIKENINKLFFSEYKHRSLFQSIIPIEYGLENIKEGIIIGISKLDSSISIIIYDMCDDPIIQILKEINQRINQHVFSNVLKLALDISITGREGKKIGTAFIIGDSENVLLHSHQMIINPYKSQERKDKDILKKENWESIMNFAQLDGVFIVSSSGEVISAGRYLDVDAHDLNIEKGLGSRHISAASITRDTKAIAIIISESGGTIRLYMDGKEVFCITPNIMSIVINKEIIENNDHFLKPK